MTSKTAKDSTHNLSTLLRGDFHEFYSPNYSGLKHLMVDYHFSFSILIYAKNWGLSHHFSDQTTSWFSDLKYENNKHLKPFEASSRLTISVESPCDSHGLPQKLPFNRPFCRRLSAVSMIPTPRLEDLEIQFLNVSEIILWTLEYTVDEYRDS